MTMYVRCDKCGREEIVRGCLPPGWRNDAWDSVDGIIEKQYCPDCWEKVFIRLIDHLPGEKIIRGDEE